MDWILWERDLRHDKVNNVRSLHLNFLELFYGIDLTIRNFFRERR